MVPYFSILLPTKNRSHLVSYAIRSVLQQNFEDFEIIVCDNDDDEVATRSVVQKFNDNRIKYIRTGGLDMVGNWNRALDAATGDHVTVLEDKMIFYPCALSNIKDEIEAVPTGVVIWHSDVIEDSSVPATLKQLIPCGKRVVSSAHILGLVVEDIMKHWTLLPRGLSCSVPKKLIDFIKKETSAAFYERISPDFTSAIKILAHIDSVLVVSESYSLFVSKSSSNGRMVSQGNKNVLKYFFGNSQIDTRCEHVAVKNIMVVANSVINDYRNVSSKYGGKLKTHYVTNKSYVEAMTRELVRCIISTNMTSWGRDEITQLIMSDGKPIQNLFCMFAYVVTWIAEYSLRKLGLNKPKKNFQVESFESDSLERVELFLSGEADLGLSKCFPAQ